MKTKTRFGKSLRLLLASSLFLISLGVLSACADTGEVHYVSDSLRIEVQNIGEPHVTLQFENTHSYEIEITKIVVTYYRDDSVSKKVTYQADSSWFDPLLSPTHIKAGSSGTISLLNSGIDNDYIRAQFREVEYQKYVNTTGEGYLALQISGWVFTGVLITILIIYTIIILKRSRRTITYQHKGHTITIETYTRVRELYVDNKLVDRDRTYYYNRSVALTCTIEGDLITVIIDKKFYRPTATIIIGGQTIKL